MKPRTFCGECSREIFGQPQPHSVTGMPVHYACDWAHCETCGIKTRMTGTRRCDGCWEVEHRLRAYLNTGGDKALAFVLTTLAAFKSKG